MVDAESSYHQPKMNAKSQLLLLQKALAPLSCTASAPAAADQAELQLKLGKNLKLQYPS